MRKSSWHRDCFSRIFRNKREPLRSGVILAEDIFDEENDDFDHDAGEEMVEDSPADFSGEIKTVKKDAFIKERGSKIKNRFKLRFGSKKAILILAVSLVLLIGLGSGAWLFFTKESPETVHKGQHAPAVKEDPASALPRKDQVVFEDIVDLEPFERIQLKPGSTMGLVSMNLSLELTDHRFRKQVYTMEDRIRSIVTSEVGELTWLSLRSPEGKIMLKYNLLQRINAIFPAATVRNIYFTTFIMQ